MHIPSAENNFQSEHAGLLRTSFARLLDQDLLAGTAEHDANQFATKLFQSSAVVVSHGTQEDPIFNYGNQAALDLFEMDWASFTELPSRKSAEPLNRDERARLLDAVTKDGFIDDYSGVRISSTGRRFMIPKAIVWNVIDDAGVFCGQAATFSNWEFLWARAATRLGRHYLMGKILSHGWKALPCLKLAGTIPHHLRAFCLFAYPVSFAAAAFRVPSCSSFSEQR